MCKLTLLRHLSWNHGIFSDDLTMTVWSCTQCVTHAIPINRAQRGHGLPHVANSEKEDYDSCDGCSQGTSTAVCKDSKVKVSTVGGIVAANPTVIEFCSITTLNWGTKIDIKCIHVYTRVLLCSTYNGIATYLLHMVQWKWLTRWGKCSRQWQWRIEEDLTWAGLFGRGRRSP